MTDTTPATDRLTGIVRGRRTHTARVNLDPATTYEVVTRQMVEDLTRELSAVRQRIDTLFWVVITSIVVDVLVRWVGG